MPDQYSPIITWSIVHSVTHPVNPIITSRRRHRHDWYTYSRYACITCW